MLDPYARSIYYDSAGVYTPVLYDGANVVSSSAYSCRYFRSHNLVIVSGTVWVESLLAASTPTELGISLPLVSNLSAVSNLSGVAAQPGVPGNRSAAIYGDTANKRASMNYYGTAAQNDFSFIFTYSVE
jgi:hypothetical protein